MSTIPKKESSFRFFYRHIGNYFFLIIFFSLLVGLLDGIGLSLFLPLLQMLNESQDSAYLSENAGNLKIIIDLMNVFGIDFKIGSILMLMTIFFCLKGLFVFFESAFAATMQQKFAFNVRKESSQGFNELDFIHFVKADGGQIQNALTGEITRVTQAFGSFYLTIQNLILVLVYVGFAIYVDFQFAIMVCIGGGLTNVLFKVLNSKTKKASIDFSDFSNRFQSLIIQMVGNFKYLKATGNNHRYNNKLNEKIIDLKSIGVKIGVLSAIAKGAREPLIILVVCSVIYIQAAIFENPLGPILISLLFFYRSLTSVLAAQTSWNYYLGNVGALLNIQDLNLEFKSNKEKLITENIVFNKEIEISNATLILNKNLVLDNLSLKIKKNSSTALVGESGSGKTSLINVLAGLYPLNSGQIIVDGKVYTDLRNSSHRTKIGYIIQEPVIFHDTVFNNVTLWSEKTKENVQRFNEVLQKTSLTNFILDLEFKEDTIIGLSGVNISGGQKQRLSIAREIFKKTEILILDEATSALDTETEQEIQKTIQELQGTMTIITIAHRLSTIKNCDNIVLMNKGKIIDSGTFISLQEKQPSFRLMVELQNI